MATEREKLTRSFFERGVALIIGLVILAVLSLIGGAAFSITTQEERMAGNSRDRMRAFEAAEASLRDCEAWVASGNALFDGSQQGMYLVSPNASTTASITESGAAKVESWWQNPSGATNVRQLVDASNKPFNGNSVAPSCVAEQFWIAKPGATPTGTAIKDSDKAFIAHITAHGYGLNKNTVVRLESYYAM
ncbi:MAG TPA: PilX N-terminal domain-containing pilus assembly protein [Vicinamibacterales bacterium]